MLGKVALLSNASVLELTYMSTLHSIHVLSHCSTAYWTVMANYNVYMISCETCSYNKYIATYNCRLSLCAFIEFVTQFSYWNKRLQYSHRNNTKNVLDIGGNTTKCWRFKCLCMYIRRVLDIHRPVHLVVELVAEPSLYPEDVFTYSCLWSLL